MSFEFDNNRVYLCGKVVSNPEFSHEVYGEGFYEINLEVNRLSEQYDIIPITISERLMKGVNLGLGGTLAIVGQFRSYNKMVDNKSKLMLTVFVREVVEPVEGQNCNIIELEGYLCKTPVYRMTPFKREICDMLLAVNRAYNKSDYLPCIAWGRNARFVSDLGVGEKIYLTGRIQSRQYQKRIDEENSETRTAYEVSVNKLSTTNNLVYQLKESAEQFAKPAAACEQK